MIVKERDLIIHQPSNTNVVYLACTACGWGIGLEPASGFVTQEADRAFARHNCEDYAKT